MDPIVIAIIILAVILILSIVGLVIYKLTSGTETPEIELATIEGTGIAGYDAKVLEGQTAKSCGQALIDGDYKTADFEYASSNCYLSNVGLEDVDQSNRINDSGWLHIYRK